MVCCKASTRTGHQRCFRPCCAYFPHVCCVDGRAKCRFIQTSTRVSRTKFNQTHYFANKTSRWRRRRQQHERQQATKVITSGGCIHDGVYLLVVRGPEQRVHLVQHDRSDHAQLHPAAVEHQLAQATGGGDDDLQSEARRGKANNKTKEGIDGWVTWWLGTARQIVT